MISVEFLERCGMRLCPKYPHVNNFLSFLSKLGIRSVEQDDYSEVFTLSECLRDIYYNHYED